ncbi:hypothetical protein SAMN05216188_115172 [Lentzea xinjiangensis]|uniref:Uncharacterized protein n=1 Tax=Lentzea xinjiangensis TaxID=402600 RepID=A0A1H9S051_9PSEU|nr:hypothetical protein [Lentzea xinjiangensis]SER78391.1 hypothetical protein SAMN05216188_115172 [Lentzea xinjiangensis]
MAQAVPAGVGEFRGLVHEAARRAGGEVTRWCEPEVTPNFYAAHVEYGDHRPGVAVLRSHAGDVALAVGHDRQPLVFADDAALLSVLSELGLRVRTSAELRRPFQAAEWPLLDVRDVRYWRPHTVGEALFNRWD